MNISSQKRRILGKVVLPFCTKELMDQFQKAMKALTGVVIPLPYKMEDFERVIDRYPLLASPLSALRPSDCRQFWETFVVWLIEKAFETELKMMPNSPSIGPDAHRLDIEVLAFASQHPWPAIIWRDVHCYRCACLSVINRTHSFDNKCMKHRCQAWAAQLLALQKESTGQNAASPRSNRTTARHPRWSQLTDTMISSDYGEVVAFQLSSDEELFNRTELDDQPICFNTKPVLAWRTDTDHERSDSKVSTHQKKGELVRETDDVNVQARRNDSKCMVVEDVDKQDISTPSSSSEIYF